MIHRTLPLFLATAVALALVFVALGAPGADPATYFTANFPPPTDAQAVTARVQFQGQPLSLTHRRRPE